MISSLPDKPIKYNFSKSHRKVRYASIGYCFVLLACPSAKKFNFVIVLIGRRNDDDYSHFKLMIT